MTKIKIKTPAKINLSLEITGKLPGGFHSLSSVMQTVSLYDFLTIEKIENASIDNKINLSGNRLDIPYDEHNIVYKAIYAYLNKIEASGITVNVDFEKHIPVQAGLAGGSTNAAGALVAVNKLFNDILSFDELHKIAETLGSDLNFCLEGGACLVSSRGEIIDEKLPYRDVKYVLVKPKHISIPTGLCYKNFAQKYYVEKPAFYSKNIVDIFKNDFSIENLAKNLYNDLEKPAFDMAPELEKIKNKLSDFGVSEALMSGSGSSVFGILDKKTEVKFSDKDFEVFYVNSTSNSVVII